MELVGGLLARLKEKTMLLNCIKLIKFLARQIFALDTHTHTPLKHAECQTMMWTFCGMLNFAVSDKPL